MKYYLHIYVNGHLELQTIHSSRNDAVKDYVSMRVYYPKSNLGGKATGVVTWEIIEVEEEDE